MRRKQALAAAAAVMALAGVSACAEEDIVLLAHDFRGGGGLLHGCEADVGGAWAANSAFLDDGRIDGALEGSALLPFTPTANSRYTLSLEVLNPSDRWVALGFARDGLITPGGDNVNDRLSNEVEGIAWMLLRNSPSANMDVQVFAGLRNSGGLYSGDPIADFSRPHTLSIVIDTTGDGTRFTAEFRIDGRPVCDGPQLIDLPVEEINFACISFDNATAAEVRIGKFRLTQVPEPESLVVFGMCLPSSWFTSLRGLRSGSGFSR